MGTDNAAEVLKSGVYRIDLGGDWFYVGSACNLKQRERQHRSALRRGDHCNKIMQNVFNKYGVFNLTLLGRYPIDEILRREQELLNEYCEKPKCANIARVAGPSMTGRKHSPGAVEKIRIAATGRKHSDASRTKMSAAGIGKKKSTKHRAAISAAHMGKKLSPEHCAARSAAQMGRKLSLEHRAAMSAAQKGRKHTAETRAKMSAGQSARWARWREAQAAA